MDNIVTKIRDYANKLAASERLLETLESDAQEHKARVDAADELRDAAESDIAATQSMIFDLEGERESLKVEYAESLFDGDQTRQDTITSRRDELDSELLGYEQELSDKQNMLNDLGENDVEGAARLSAKLSMLDFGDGYSWASSIRQELVNYQSNLRTRVQNAQRDLPAAGTEAYEEARRKIDAEYASRQDFEQAKLDALEAKAAANKASLEELKTSVENPVDRRDINPATGYEVGGARDRAHKSKMGVMA